jgi:uncharacterized RDD family membrane protein YckC
VEDNFSIILGGDVMKKIRITTPENIEVEYILAGLGSRTAAAVIDVLIQSVVTILLIIGALLIMNFAPDFWSAYYGWIIGIALLVYAVISYGYFVALELSMNGQTIGKRFLKLRAIRKNGQPITLSHSAIRNLFRLFVDSYGVGVVLMFFTKEHKRLGDFAASTIVIVEEDKNRPVTLDSLQSIDEKFNYYVSKEERELLRDYLERKKDMENYEELRQELMAHFTKKFEALGVLEDWKDFINSI